MFQGGAIFSWQDKRFVAQATPPQSARPGGAGHARSLKAGPPEHDAHIRRRRPYSVSIRKCGLRRRPRVSVSILRANAAVGAPEVRRAPDSCSGAIHLDKGTERT
ncbi:hypothetical protein NicSoilB11_05340 [Arthrobacter sp. NicSoilB11]|nr:hypothetical protein NicSoilB11_05340 [Arthrobacter sp. NicSoilB11]